MVGDDLKLRNKVQDYLNDNLGPQVRSLVRDYERYNRTDRIMNFLDDKTFLLNGITIAIVLSIIVAILNIVCVGAHNLEISKIEAQARICQETGYGCINNTINQDIQYHDTPVVNIDTNKE